MTTLPGPEIQELIACALNTSGIARPMQRVRVRVCEHLIGRGLLEPVQPASCWNQGCYPSVVPTLKPGASVRLTEAGRQAILGLEVRDYDAYFPTASDIQRAQMKVWTETGGCVSAATPTQPNAETVPALERIVARNEGKNAS